MDTQHLTVLFAVAPEQNRDEISRTVEQHGGRLLKTLGEASIFGFDHAQRACEASSILRKTLPHWRAGLATGDVAVGKNDVFGDAVNLAARLEGVAKPGEVLFSEGVRVALGDTAIPLSSLGTQTIRGMPKPVKVFCLGGLSKSRNAVKSSPEQEKVPPEVSVPGRDQKSEKKPKKKQTEIFDFSRVEQERIQETSALALASSPSLDPDAVIPLEGESSALPDLPRPKAPQIRPLMAPRSDMKVRKRKALIHFLIWSVAVPSLLIGGGYGYHLASQKEKEEREMIMKEELAQSEVLETMKTKRKKTRDNVAVSDSENFGKILLTTTPREVDVYVGKKFISHKTPVRLKKVPAKTSLKLKIRKAGYKDHIELINIIPGEEKEMFITLKRAAQ